MNNIADKIERLAEEKDTMFTVDDIQDTIEKYLITINKYNLSRSFIKFRFTKELARDRYGKMMDAISDKLSCKDVQNQNANVDERSFGGRIGETSSMIMKQFALDYCVSPTTRNNHLNNEVYIHDLDSYSVGNHNCLSIPFDKLLKEGFNTRQTDVRPANSINTAMQLVAVIFQLQSLQQFGGVSATHLDHTMVPYVRKSFYKHYRDGLKYVQNYKERKINKILGLVNNTTSIESPDYKRSKKAYNYAMEMTQKECYQACEALFHNLNTLQSRSGN